MTGLHDDNTADTGAVPRCQVCGSERVVKDAWACWNADAGFWELERVLDGTWCHACDAARDVEWVRPDGPSSVRIRELNDRFRRDGIGNGSVLVTAGVQASGAAFVFAVLDAVRRFDGFDAGNDPWGERDFGVVEVDGQRVFFKIDYYDPTRTHGSENPGNEGCTHRVLTVMLPSEY